MRTVIAIALVAFAACAKPNAAASFALALDKHAKIFPAQTSDGKSAVIAASHRTLLYCEETADDVVCGQFANFNEPPKPSPAAPAPAPAPAPPAAKPDQAAETVTPAKTSKAPDAKPQAPPPAKPTKQ